MNTLEQLKRAKEGEPMAVLVMPCPKNCNECHACFYDQFNDTYWCFGCSEHGYISREITQEQLDSVPDWCKLRKAIALIEPNGHLVCLGRWKNESYSDSG